MFERSLKRVPRTVVRVVLVVLLGPALPACDRGGSAPEGAPKPAPTAAPASAEDARAVWVERCVVCHGADGRGGAPSSVGFNAGLTATPPDFSDAEWQASRTDAQIEAMIASGGAALGRSPLMPGNPDLAARPGMLEQLRLLIRTLDD